jgi:hypothetical protein
MSEIKGVDDGADRVAESVRRALRLVGHAENGVEYATVDRDEDVREDAAVVS